MAHAVALLDEYSRRGALERILLSIARKALDGGFSFVFFFSSDDRLKSLYRRFGMVFPPDLRFPDTAHLVGVYDPANPRNLERMRRIGGHLGLDPELPTVG